MRSIEEEKRIMKYQDLFYQGLGYSLRRNIYYSIFNKEDIEEIYKDSPLTLLRRKILQFDNNRQPERSEEYPIKLMICLTMFDESFSQFKYSMEGILQGISEIKNFTKIKLNEIVIVLIADGLNSIHKNFLAKMSEKGFYKQSLIKHNKKDALLEEGKINQEREQTLDTTSSNFNIGNKSQDKMTNFLHLFQRINCRENFGTKVAKEDILPYNFFFGIKLLNSGKLDSYFVFFQDFAEYLKPKYTFLLETGTKPKPLSLYRLFYNLEYNSDSIGLLGEIEVKTSGWRNCFTLSNLVIASQFIEHQISYFLHGSLGKICIPLSMIPGTFLRFCYRRNSGYIHQNYFLRLYNIYDYYYIAFVDISGTLQNDCFYFYQKSDNSFRWEIGDQLYSTSLMAYLMSSRQRWIRSMRNNGLPPSAQITSNHCWRLFAILQRMSLPLFFLFPFISSFLSIIQIGFGYATFSIFARKVLHDDTLFLANILEDFYLLVLLGTTFLTLKKSIERGQLCYMPLAVLQGLIMLFTLLLINIFSLSIWQNKAEIKMMLFLLVLLLGLYFALFLLYTSKISNCNLFFLGLVPYLFLSPFFINPLFGCAYSQASASTGRNLDRDSVRSQPKFEGVGKSTTKRKLDDNQNFLFCLLAIWGVINSFICYGVSYFRQISEVCTYWVSISTICIVIIKLIFSIGVMYKSDNYHLYCCCFRAEKPKKMHQLPASRLELPVEGKSVYESSKSGNSNKDYCCDYFFLQAMLKTINFIHSNFYKRFWAYY